MTNQPIPKINKIAVDAQGRVFLNDQLVIIPQLKDKQAQLQSDHPDLSILIPRIIGVIGVRELAMGRMTIRGC